MKSHLLSILIMFIGMPAFAWQSEPPRKPGETETEIVVLGDINHDKVIDTTYVTHAKWISEDEYYGDCHSNACNINVTFSFKAPSIHHENSVSAWVKSIGDIDEDGTDEIVVATGWFIGCRGDRYFYTLKRGAWQLIGATYHFNCLADDEGFDPEVRKTARGRFESPTLELSEEGDEITVIKSFTIKK